MVETLQIPDRSTQQFTEGKNPAVVFTVDENFALPLAVTMHSMLTNLHGTEEIEIFVLHPFLPDATKERLRAVAEQASTTVHLSFIEVDVKEHLGDRDLQFYDRFTETIYFRLLIGSLLPERYEKVLYLDCDLVVEDNILDLWSIDMEGHVLLAAQERTVSCPMHGVNRWKELGLDPDDPYFNSGVMLIDMEKWRSQDIGPKVLSYLQQYGDSLNVRGNQEGFNAILAGQWKPISQRWNVLHYYYDPSLFDRFGHPAATERELSEITRDPSIIHFTDGPKPWQPGCTHPAQDRFHHYLRQSGWFSTLGYGAWRSALTLRTGIHWAKDVTRPLRHRLGIRR